ncbi:2'-(5''-triphosphoribosyl)-3'-dephospho-CoA:apo-citrate lyase, partial [Lacticaseibacillus paracasei subsp. paracasei Lpp126]
GSVTCWILMLSRYAMRNCIKFLAPDLALPPRACLVCGGDAKACARSRRHGLPEVQQVVETIVKESASQTA